MTVSQFKSKFKQALSAGYPSEEVESFFFRLGEAFLGMKRIDLTLYKEKELSAEQLNLFEDALARLQKNEPLQYILGETEFYGYPFKVNPSVLIPRPETEELVEWIIKDCKQKHPENRPIKILDIGTGSGCIAVTLAKELPFAQVVAIDVSEKALITAKQNATLNKVSVDFVKQDVIKLEEFSEAFDIIVSNPPYVRELEKAEILANVLENEPHQALFVKDNDPLLFYRKISMLADKNLQPDGSLYFEINQYLGEETSILLEKFGFSEIILRRDLFGKDRMLKCIKS